jgi:menaquinone-dependent protoporphyrinogen IX oxidase
MANKLALVIYDTKYGSTEQIAHWVAEGINDSDIRHVDDVTSLFYDLIVIGSPVYNDAPSSHIMAFLDRYRENLANKRIAVYTVSLPYNMTPERAKSYSGASAKVLQDLAVKVRGKVIDTKAFLGKIEARELTALDRLSLRIQYFLKGYELKDANYLNRDEAIAWGRHLYDLATKTPEPVSKERKDRKVGGSTEIRGRKGNGQKEEKK